MEDPRPGLILIMVVLSILLRFNCAVLIRGKKKRIPLFESSMLAALSPVLCLITVSYVTGRKYRKDRHGAIKGSIGLIGALLLSQFITGMIFVGIMFLFGLPVPTGRAIGPAGEGSGFDPVHILFLVSLSSLLLFLMLRIMRPERDMADLFKGRSILSTSGIAIVGLAPLIGFSALLSRFLDDMGWGTQPSLIEGVSGPADALLVGLAIVVMAPLIEEILFRGYLHDQIRSNISPFPAILTTSVLFSLAHFNIATFIPIMAMGLFMGWLRERSDSILPSMIFHSANNLIALIFVLLA